MEKGGVLSLSNICPGAQPYIAILLRHYYPQHHIVVVTEGLKTQEWFQQDAETWLQLAHDENHPASIAESLVSHSPLFYPAWEILPHEGKLPHADVISERLHTLVFLAQQRIGQGPAAQPGAADDLVKTSASPPTVGGSKPAPGALIITNVVALMQRTFTPKTLESRIRIMQRGDAIDPLDLVEWLEDQGYEPEAQVTQKGEIALRGGILDIYPPASPWPVRLEFFGNELESLRYFDPHTQKSQDTIDWMVVPPAGELGMLRRCLAPPVESAQANSTPASPVAIQLGILPDYLSSHTIFVFCEPERLAEQADHYSRQIPKDDPFFIGWPEFLAEVQRRSLNRIDLTEELAPPNTDSWEPSALPDAPGGDLGLVSLETYRPLNIQAQIPQVAEAQRREFFNQMHRWRRQGFVVLVVCNNEGERQRFSEIWQDYGLLTDDSQVAMALGALSRGFLFANARLAVITDAEIFGRYKVQRARRLKSPHAVAVRSALDIDFTDLEAGDYVVHLQYGIGRYQGLSVLPASAGRRQSGAAGPTESGQECLVIEYAPNQSDQPSPKLYVPVTEAHLVSKYVGAGKARPPLHTLGGTRWAKAKAQAEHAVRDLAGELLAIQAARASQPGQPCRADTPWQREFESSFLFEETPDQQRAIQETKTDQEASRPMDRLICGDVGFGKTEVALRAAFKSVMDGKQVAVMVPTTVLAQQHFNTFRERMADYPIRVELLSRFRTRRQQQQVVKDLAAGAVDIVIGTHRLVQEDIEFKELGLVVIDEEQRFGVLHKEKFKQMRRLVDVLTLSATPIPRTLYLALTGARDMSTIETPPHDRLPVETIVTPYDERVIREAIQRELNRQGQVFFLHNRVDTINTVAARLGDLAPQARIVVGHGQMESDELEEVMTQFVNGQADILLSTTIIESGLDIPNANTIIIDRADRFGLSDLYQLRGRVGRYKHQAYAYLLLPRHAGVLTDARKRLSAIKQYSSLGSGFKIAMRDLELRGAGNLLGAEQSGHITAVGFELYCQLLKQSVSALQGKPVKSRIDVRVCFDFLTLNPQADPVEAQAPALLTPSSSVEINVPREVATYVSEDTSKFDSPSLGSPPARIPRDSAFIPFAYIADARQRVEIYRKLAQATDHADLSRLRAECRDRFGPLLPAVELLLLATEVKILAAQKAVTDIETRGDKLMLKRNRDYLTLGGQFPRLVKTTAKARLQEIKKMLLAI